MKRKKVVKFITMICFLILAMIGAYGCGGTKAKYSKYLELYQEYYENELEEEYGEYCLADIFLDKEGLPVLWAMVGDSAFEDVDILLYTVEKNEVVEIMDTRIYRDGDEVKEVYIYTDGIVLVEDNTDGELEWYQIDKGTIERIAYHEEERREEEVTEVPIEYDGEKFVLINTYEDKKEETYNPGYYEDFTVVFETEKKEIEVDFAELSFHEYEEIYDELFKEYYGNKKQGTLGEYGKAMGVSSMGYYNIFLDSILLPIQLDDFAHDFEEKIEELIEIGYMSQNEFVVWQTNYINDNDGGEDGYEIGLHLLYQGIDLFNQIDISIHDVNLELVDNYLGTGEEYRYCEYFLNEEGDNLIENYLAYIYFTEEWGMLEEIELLEEIPQSFMEDFLKKGLSKKIDLYFRQFKEYHLNEYYVDKYPTLQNYVIQWVNYDTEAFYDNQVRGDSKAELFESYKSFMKNLDDYLDERKNYLLRDKEFIRQMYEVVLGEDTSSGWLFFDLNNQGPYLVQGWENLYVYSKGTIFKEYIGGFGAGSTYYLPNIKAFHYSGGRDGVYNSSIYTWGQDGKQVLMSVNGHEYLMDWDENGELYTIDEEEYSITDYTIKDSEGNPKGYVVTTGEELEAAIQEVTNNSSEVQLHSMYKTVEESYEYLLYNSIEEAWGAYIGRSDNELNSLLNLN